MLYDGDSSAFHVAAGRAGKVTFLGPCRWFDQAPMILEVISSTFVKSSMAAKLADLRPPMPRSVAY